MIFADDRQGVVLRLVEILDAQGIDYLMMGGIAVPIWGIPRATFDVEVTLSVDDAALRRFMAAVVAAGFTIDESFTKGFRNVPHGMEKLRIAWWNDSGRRVEVDVFLVTTPYQVTAFARRVPARIGDHQMYVLSAADLILHELVANRPKDLADIQNVLAIQGVPDETYLRDWAQRLGVTARLEGAIRQIDG